MADDSELVRGMLEGREQAFNAFFGAYFPRVYRFALPRLNSDAEAAREVVQSTLVKAVRNLASWRAEAALFTWICQICRREIVDHLRVHHRHAENVVLIEDSPELRAVFEAIEAPAEGEPVNRCTQEETARLVRTVLDRLPDRYGDALEWKYIDGLSVEEIGDRLGIGQTAAQSLLARARTAFRDAVEAVFGAEAADVLAGFG